MNISYLTTQEAVCVSLTLSPICSLQQRQTVSGEAVPTCEKSSRLKAQSRELISTSSILAPHLGQTPTTSAHRDCTVRTRTGKEPALSGPSVQLLSRIKLCDPVDCSMQGLLIHHQLPELTQTHVHQVSGAIQPSHPPSPPSPPTFNFSQKQDLFQ